MEVFVLVACPQTALLDSRDFLAPIITVFEAELAFTGSAWKPGTYRSGFSDVPLPADARDVECANTADALTKSDASDSAPSRSTQLTVRSESGERSGAAAPESNALPGCHRQLVTCRYNLGDRCKLDLPGETWLR